MKKIKELLKKYKFIILYGIFGALTTIINIAVYGVFYNVLGVSNVISNIIAWILSVLFAFITNKLWVFESKSFDFKIFMKELGSFTACRLATGVLDLGIMFVGVDLLKGPAMILKVASNIIVIILNYVMSKLFVFKKWVHLRTFFL